jgi:hypothetical protein
MFGAPIFLSLLVLCCGYALWRGNRDAQIVAVTCCLAVLATHLAIAPLRERYASVEEGLILVDGLTLVVFVLVALKSDRFWPLWVAGLQLTAAVAHLLKALHLELLPQAYGAALAFWSYPILIVLAVGAYRSHRRARRRPT